MHSNRVSRRRVKHQQKKPKVRSSVVRGLKYGAAAYGAYKLYRGARKAYHAGSAAYHTLHGSLPSAAYHVKQYYS